jgi:hypothetical protein
VCRSYVWHPYFHLNFHYLLHQYLSPDYFYGHLRILCQRDSYISVPPSKKVFIILSAFSFCHGIIILGRANVPYGKNIIKAAAQAVCWRGPNSVTFVKLVGAGLMMYLMCQDQVLETPLEFGKVTPLGYDDYIVKVCLCNHNTA